MIPLSEAITQTGAAGMIVDAMVAAIGGSGPALLLTGIFTVTAVLGQLISCTLDPRIHSGQHDDHATLLVPVFWPSRATWRSSTSPR